MKIESKQIDHLPLLVNEGGAFFGVFVDDDLVAVALGEREASAVLAGQLEEGLTQVVAKRPSPEDLCGVIAAWMREKIGGEAAETAVDVLRDAANSEGVHPYV